jgi:hypothetical protein
VLAHKGLTLENHFSLFHYKIGADNNLSKAKPSTGDKGGLELKPYEINLILMKKEKKVVPSLNLNMNKSMLSPPASS